MPPALIIAFLIVAVLSSGLFLQHRLLRGAPVLHRVSSSHEFQRLNSAAKLALGTSNAVLVRRLVEHLTEGTTFVLSSGTMNRIVEAELAFRSGSRPPINSALLSAGLNGFVRELACPIHFQTNEAQFNALSDAVSSHVPDFIDPAGNREPAVFSPASGVFILLVMLQQKISSPDSRMPPDQVIEMLRKSKQSQDGGEVKKTQVFFDGTRSACR